MDNFLGQLQFRLQDSRVTYYCGEQYLRNARTIRTVVDGNQTEFVFVQGEDGELYYISSVNDRLLERKCQSLNISGSSFSVVRDDRGFLVVLVVLDCNLYVVRQQVYHPDLFEAPVLVYTGEDMIHEVEAMYWESQLHLALRLGTNRSHRVIVGVRQEDMVWEELKEVSKDTAFHWVTNNGTIYLDIAGSKRYFPSSTLNDTDYVGLHRCPTVVRQFTGCPAAGMFEAFGLVRVAGRSHEVFCGYHNQEWHMISGVQNIVSIRHCVYRGRYHILLLDRVGVVYYVVIHMDGTIHQRVLLDLGLVKSMDLVLTKNGLKAYAIDAMSGFVQVMTMICPERGWKIEPFVLYYQKQYQIQIMQCPTILDRLQPVSEYHILPGLHQGWKLLFQQECNA